MKICIANAIRKKIDEADASPNREFKFKLIKKQLVEASASTSLFM